MGGQHLGQLGLLRRARRLEVFGRGEVAGLATTPYAAFHFHRVTPYGVLANLAAMPVVSVLVMPAGLLGLVAMPFGFDGVEASAGPQRALPGGRKTPEGAGIDRLHLAPEQRGHGPLVLVEQ